MTRYIRRNGLRFPLLLNLIVQAKNLPALFHANLCKTLDFSQTSYDQYTAFSAPVIHILDTQSSIVGLAHFPLDHR